MASLRLATMTLGADIRSRYQELAEVRIRAPHCWLRAAVSQHVEREKAREGHASRYAQGARTAFRENGLHAIHAEADGWMARRILALADGMDPEFRSWPIAHGDSGHLVLCRLHGDQAGCRPARVSAWRRRPESVRWCPGRGQRLLQPGPVASSCHHSHHFETNGF